MGKREIQPGVWLYKVAHKSVRFQNKKHLEMSAIPKQNVMIALIYGLSRKK